MQLIITADENGAGITLTEPEDLRRLAASTQLVPSALDQALRARGIGSCDGEHIWLNIGELRAIGPAEDEWRRGYDAMIAYADGHGWVADGCVRVHLSDDD
ncbi:hypothetical protein Y013_25770 (plasmid) [Rhodococcus pyridinivorans SB3094]|uniref:Uncharacterized protein n=2 Tax=Rhodococcus TaxID=1827 RepID=V9XQ45_9NOCA|nr:MULTISPECIES: hypothetical protein [Rhodococcus]AHD24125.1 hypothetical protein Y013_25770 [Rhodococcus pyridinivorans SB3094]AYA23254.1 hypothetical protein C6369_000805 [Rhodococcus rhodochrous]KOS57547.1 hypothetical protein Z051_03420 [Rhodococcus rhodochrous KG-21]QSE72387.1 hypothetical protein JYA91_29040 [Rhodococcus sp. PSBB049]